MITSEILTRVAELLLAVVFVLGGLQGALGWFMVQSGLSVRTDVSQYRLAAHFLAALAIYSYMFWTALTLLRAPSTDGPARRLRPHLLAIGAAHTAHQGIRMKKPAVTRPLPPCDRIT